MSILALSIRFLPKIVKSAFLKKMSFVSLINHTRLLLINGIYEGVFTFPHAHIHTRIYFWEIKYASPSIKNYQKKNYFYFPSANWVTEKYFFFFISLKNKVYTSVFSIKKNSSINLLALFWKITLAKILTFVNDENPYSQQRISQGLIV